MMRQLLAITFLLAAPGCYEMHGRPTPGADAGLPLPTPRRDVGVAPVDAGVCESAPMPAELRCPASVALGEHLVVRAAVSAPGCCGSEGAALDVVGEVPDVELVASWSLCTCCLDCDCETPPADVGVDLGVIRAPGTVRVRLAEQVCEIEVLPPSMCEAIREDAIIVPAVRLVGETIPVLVRTDTGNGCGCVPRARLRDREGLGPDFVLEVCDCSDIDPCVDAGYEVSFVAAPSTVAEPRQFYQGGGRAIVDVRHPDGCGSVPIDGTVAIDELRVIAPDPGRIGDGGTWLEIRGHDVRCCGAPAIAVVATDEPDTYGLMECQFDLCDCAIGRRVDFTTYHYLGELGGERRVIRVHDRDVVIDL